MCKFFSAISNGKGKVLFFKTEDVVEIMSLGNKKDYNFNSHSSISNYFGIKAKDEHKYNFWEYDTTKKELNIDTLNTADDRKKTLSVIEKYLNKKDIAYIQNLYNMNSGYRNSGDMNSGNMNSGDRNSGNMNSGNMNSGDRNSGYMNSGDRNSGNMNSGDRNSCNMNSGNRNSGYRNSGDMNSGYRNSGDMNSGNRNSGDRNSGYMNSGYRNSGNRNSGNMNSGDGINNSFCSETNYMLFNEKCSKEEYEKIHNIDVSFVSVVKWIAEADMTQEEKENHPYFKTTNGYLKKIDYKESWKNCPKKELEKIKKLKNFDSNVFEEITGLKKGSFQNSNRRIN